MTGITSLSLCACAVSRSTSDLILSASKRKSININNLYLLLLSLITWRARKSTWQSWKVVKTAGMLLTKFKEIREIHQLYIPDFEFRPRRGSAAALHPAFSFDALFSCFQEIHALWQSTFKLHPISRCHHVRGTVFSGAACFLISSLRYSRFSAPARKFCSRFWKNFLFQSHRKETQQLASCF